MRVLFLQPSIPKRDVYGRVLAASNNVPPLGLASLASCIRHEQKVKIIDGWPSAVSSQQIEREIRTFAPDIVGVTSTTTSHPTAVRVFNQVKTIDREIITLYGGVHVTAVREKAMYECKDIDLGVIGEGENTIRELLAALVNKKQVRAVKGILYRQHDCVKATSPRLPIADLDSLPFPAYDLLKPLERYSMIQLRIGGKGPIMSVITSRGCPHSCRYCDQTVFGRTWRAHSAEYVVRNLVHLNEVHAIKRISFEDDNIATDKRRLIDICRGIIEAGLDISFSLSARIEVLDETLLSWLRKAGCSSLFFGLESGNPTTLKRIGKSADLRAVQERIRRIKSHGIKTFGAFIYGLPEETKEDMRKTQRFAMSSGLDGASFHLFTPFPHTEMGDEAHKYGELNPDLRYYSGHSPVPPFVPDGWTAEELLEFQRKSYLRYYVRPSWLFANRRLLLQWDFARRAIHNLASLLNPLRGGGGWPQATAHHNP